MRHPTAILFLSRDAWRVSADDSTVSDAQPTSGVPETANAIVAALGQRDHLVIALDATDCMASTISLDDLPRRDRRQAMVYRLEEKLPVAAEEFAANFIEAKPNQNAFGVVTRVDVLRPLLAALEARGVAVEAIVPAAIIALAAVPERMARDVVCWRRANGWELIELTGGAPSGWFVLPDASAEDADGELLRRLGLLAAARGHALKLVVLGVPAGRFQEAESLDSVAFVENWTLDNAVWNAVSARADVERAGMWMDLRQDELAAGNGAARARRPMLLAAAGAVVLFVAIGLAGTLRAAKYGRIAAAGDRRLTAIYVELFPGTPVPTAIRSRLASEARLASPDRVDATTSSPVPSATRVLVNCLARLPAPSHTSISELHIGGDAATLSLAGEAQSFIDAQALATAIRGAPSAAIAKLATNALLSFDVDSPRTTQRTDRSVAFSLNATPRVPALTVKASPDNPASERQPTPRAATPTQTPKLPTPTSKPVLKKGKR